MPPISGFCQPNMPPSGFYGLCCKFLSLVCELVFSNCFGDFMSAFNGRHFTGEVVLWAVRWYCRYGVSYRDLEQMMAERGARVDHATIDDL